MKTNHASLMLVSAAMMTSTGLAQSIRPSSVRVEVNDWHVVPLVSGDGAGCQVDSMVAFAREGTTIGDNLVAVWYVRGGEGWEAKSWSTTDRWSIVEQLKGAYNIGDEDDYRWGVASSDGAAAGTPIENFGSGVLESDPLAPLIEAMPDPQAAVSLLIDGGYPAAMPLNATSLAGVNAMLDAIETAVGIEACIEDPGTLNVAQSLAASGAMAGTIVVPISDRPMGPPGPWTPVPSNCDTIRHGNACVWITVCKFTRAQNYLRKRTKACVIAGVMVFCDQWAVITCTEEDPVSCPGITVPGMVGGNGECFPPVPPPPPPAAPCGGPYGGPNVPISPKPRTFNPSVPKNCDLSPAGWMPPTCACP